MSKISIDEVLETLQIISEQKLNIRAVTLGLNVLDCAGSSYHETSSCLKRKIKAYAEKFIKAAEEVENKYGLPITNKRITISPVYFLLERYPLSLARKAAYQIGKSIDEAAKEAGIDLIGGFTALASKRLTKGGRALLEELPNVLKDTEHLCSSVEVGRTNSGINVDAIILAAKALKKASYLTKGKAGARFVVLANAPSDIPFMAGGFHGPGEGDSAVNVAISAPGVIGAVVKNSKNKKMHELSEEIKKISFKVSRAAQLIGSEIASKINSELGSIDLSLAPAPEEGESVAAVIREMGIDSAGLPGSIAALALLTDAIKKGGIMGAMFVGGYSGAFIPVSEDLEMSEAAKKGFITIPMLQAMSSVCSTGLDMVAIPGETSWETIASLMLDEVAIGVFTNKTVGVRLLPVPGALPGDEIELGGLFGKTYVMKVLESKDKSFIRRGGRIPAPTFSHRN